MTTPASATPPRRFVGIAVDHYQCAELPDLPRPVADVHRVRKLLGDTYLGDLLTDPTEDDVSSHLRLVAKRGRDCRRGDRDVVRAR